MSKVRRAMTRLRSRNDVFAEADSPKLFTDYGRPRQVWELAGGPAVAGVVCGVALHVNLWVYLVCVALGVAGGLGAGAQHRTFSTAAARGLCVGTVWAGALLVSHAVIAATTETTATVAIPHPEIMFFLWGAIPTSLVAAISFAVARRAHSRAT